MPPSIWLSPYRWLVAALIGAAAGIVPYAMETDTLQQSRLREPVPSTGRFVDAQCITDTKRRTLAAIRMVTTYEFVAVGFVQYGYENGVETAQSSPTFSARGERDYRSRIECDATLPAVRAARQSQPVWFEASNPRTAVTSLAEPDSRRFLWICLSALPPLAVGLWLILLRRQRRHAGQPLDPGHPLVRFIAIAHRRGALMLWLLILGTGATVIYKELNRERAGAERLRTSAFSAPS